MKRAQKEALASCCGGRCQEARDLAQDLEASGEALDREAARNRALQASVRALQAEIERLRAELSQVRTEAECRRGLVP